MTHKKTVMQGNQRPICPFYNGTELPTLPQYIVNRASLFKLLCVHLKLTLRYCVHLILVTPLTQVGSEPRITEGVINLQLTTTYSFIKTNQL